MASVAVESSQPGFRVELHDDADGAKSVLLLAGPIGMDAEQALRTQVEGLAAGSRDVAIDWAQAEYVSTSAIQLLLALGIRLAGSGRRMVVGSDNRGTRRVLESAGLSGYFNVEPL